ncbi:hypothetical protein EDC01DRAFT_635565 [Geopyxis carbonaria]|nr:hypothetical protein EDC01DRAFT_635565 [Geopyxis carbonaria]
MTKQAWQCKAWQLTGRGLAFVRLGSRQPSPLGGSAMCDLSLYQKAQASLYLVLIIYTLEFETLYTGHLTFPVTNLESATLPVVTVGDDLWLESVSHRRLVTAKKVFHCGPSWEELSSSAIEFSEVDLEGLKLVAVGRAFFTAVILSCCAEKYTVGRVFFIVYLFVEEFSSLAVTLASLDETAVRGRDFLVRICWKFTNWSTWISTKGPTEHLFRKADVKVWDLFIRSEDPVLRRLSEDISIDLLARSSPVYLDGFPVAWRDSESTVLESINSFRHFARFWYHTIYDSSSGPPLKCHRSDLPEDYPESEEAAYRQVGLRLVSIQTGLHSTPIPISGQPATRQSVDSERASSVRILETPAARASPRLPSRASRATSAELRPLNVPEDSPTPFGISRRKGVNVPMAVTTFSHKVVATALDEFDGKPQNLALLDQSVENLCVEQAYPAYWGGTVKGSVEMGYEYVPCDTPGSAPNYYLGSRVCAAICGKFTGDAKLWWAGYRKDNAHPRPNCWKLASQNPDGTDSKPDDVVEISLYNLIEKAFPSNDAAKARSELRRFKWDPSAKDALSLSAFKYQVMELLSRAGFNAWELQCEEIRDCLEPSQFRDKVDSWDDPDDFWKQVKAASSAWSHDHAPSSVKRCDHCSGPHDTKSCRKVPVRAGRSGDSRTLGTCDFCGVPGHYKKNCFKYKATLRNETQVTESKTSSYQPAVQRSYGRPAARGSKLPYPMGSRSGAHGGDGFKALTCRNCKGVGHLADVCPSRKSAMAAHNTESKEDDKSGKGGTAMYFMNAWCQRGAAYAARAGPKNVAKCMADDEGVDELFSLLYAEQSVDFPLYNNLSKLPERNEVLTLAGNSDQVTVKVSDSLDMTKLGPPADENPSGPLWTVSSTLKNQDLLTIFDTGAVKAAIPMSTATGTNSVWSSETPHPISFIKADGSTYKPAGTVPIATWDGISLGYRCRSVPEVESCHFDIAS